MRGLWYGLLEGPFEEPLREMTNDQAPVSNQVPSTNDPGRTRGEGELQGVEGAGGCGLRQRRITLSGKLDIRFSYGIKCCWMYENSRPQYSTAGN
jgi:hypothetical protein